MKKLLPLSVTLIFGAYYMFTNHKTIIYLNNHHGALLVLIIIALCVIIYQLDAKLTGKKEKNKKLEEDK